MASLIYVDNSNLIAVGGELLGYNDSARGYLSCRYGRLFDMLTFGETPARARLYGSSETNKSQAVVSEAALKAGFEPRIFRRPYGGKEKGVDTALVTDLIADSFTVYAPGDELILVAGDGDYLPLVDHLKSRDIRLSVVFWDRGLSQGLRVSGCNWVSLQPHLRSLIHFIPHKSASRLEGQSCRD